MTSSEKLSAWLQLLRVPNLFTVPGDPLAGFCLAAVAVNTDVAFSSIKFFSVLLIGLLSYCAGLLQNDYFDLKEDRRDRPSRPLPADKVAPTTVIIVSSFLAAACIAIAFLVGIATGITAFALVLVITIYNRSAKHVPIVGPFFMGLCRGLSFLLGASVLGWSGIIEPASIIGSVSLTLYIAAVTIIAAGETVSYRSGALRWGPVVILLACFSGLYFLVRPSSLLALPVSAVLAVLSCCWALYCGGLLKTGAPPAVVQKTIGRFLRGLLLIQAAIIALSGYPGFIVVIILLAAWPVSQKLARHFYES